MATRKELSAEERLILAFAEADFKKQGMNRALAMVRNPEIKLADLRAVVDFYRDRWRQRQRLTVLP